MKSKSKLSSNIQDLVLSKARAYIKPVQETFNDDSDEEERKQLRKASAEDKARKREKMRLKRQRKSKQKREARERNKKKGTSEEKKFVNPEAKKLAINYLHMWNSARDMWSFKKKPQCWLLKNAFDVKNISNENFEILLNYIVDLKGEAKKRLTTDCEEAVKKHEEKFEDGTISAEDSVIFERAGNILQILV